MIRALPMFSSVLLLSALNAFAETTTNILSATNSAVSATEIDEAKQWSFSTAIYTYIVPDSREYVQPTITADHGWLHLEARYNYEDLETGSTWLGYNLSGGEKLSWEFKPMLGGV